MTMNNKSVPIVPALDLLNGRVVKAIAGKRSCYKPLCFSHNKVSNEGVGSPSLAPHTSESATHLYQNSKGGSQRAIDVEEQSDFGAECKSIAELLLEVSGSSSLYVADLDAIAGGQIDWRLICELLRLRSDLWLDAGVRTVEDADRLFVIDEASHSSSKQLARLIVGTETLCDPNDLQAILQQWGSGRVMLSLDLRDGEPIVASSSWKNTSPLQIVREVVSAGIQSVLVLDIASVGMSAGPRTCSLIQQLRGEFPTLELIAGGGIRNNGDLQRLAAVGANAAVASTWLHRLASLRV